MSIVSQVTSDTYATHEIDVLYDEAQAWQLRPNIYRNNWRLRHLVVATLLRAGDEPEHPFHRAAASAPDLLLRIERVIRRGGEAAHDSDEETIDLTSLNSTVQDTLELVGLFSGLPVRSLEEILRDG